MPIRIAQPGDIPEILSIYAPYVENTAYSFEYTVPGLEEFTRRFDRITAQFPWLVWEEESVLLGYAYADAPFARAAFSWCAEPSIYLRPEACRRGIGSRLYRALEAILIRQGYERFYALVATENTGSIAFHLARGYRTVGTLAECGVKFSRRVGLLWMEKTAKYDDIPKEMPMPFPELMKNDRNFASILYKMSIS